MALMMMLAAPLLRKDRRAAGTRPTALWCALDCRLRLVLLKLEDARVSPIGHFGQHQQVIATKALRGFPLLAVLVEAGEGDVVPRAAFGFVWPNRSLDTSDSDFSDGFLG